MSSTLSTALVRVNGRLQAFHELSASDLQAALSPAQAEALGESLGASRAPKVDAFAERSTGKAHERERWTAVMKHEASAGRQKQAADLLNSRSNASAAEIIAALKDAPTDSAQAAAVTNAESRDVWGKALARIHGSN